MPQGNPFDAPLASEQKAQPPTQPAGNPFDVPLPSEQKQTAAQPKETLSPNPGAGEVPTFGDSSMPVSQRLTMPLVKALVGIHDKLREVQNYSQEGREQHPIQAKLGDVANAIEGLLIGSEAHPESSIGTGKYGVLNNPVSGSILPVGEGPAAAKVAEEAGPELEAGARAVASKAAKIPREIMQGKEIAQEPAQAAIREAVGAEKGAPLLEGNKTILDDTLSGIKSQEQAAYKKLDDAAGFDLKAEKEALANDQYKLKQLGNTEADQATRQKLTGSIQDSQGRITEAESKLKQVGIDPREPDILHKQRIAGQDIKKALIQATTSDGEAINVDSFLNSAKKLRFSKYGDRLAQFFGSSDKADEFMSKLQEAQEAGAHAVKTQAVAKWAARIGAFVVGEEALRRGVGAALR